MFCKTLFKGTLSLRLFFFINKIFLLLIHYIKGDRLLVHYIKGYLLLDNCIKGDLLIVHYIKEEKFNSASSPSILANLDEDVRVKEVEKQISK